MSNYLGSVIECEITCVWRCQLSTVRQLINCPQLSTVTTEVCHKNFHCQLSTTVIWQMEEQKSEEESKEKGEEGKEDLNLFKASGIQNPENWQCIWYIVPTA